MTVHLSARYTALTDESFDAQRLDLHVDQQSAVCFHQCRGQGNTGLGVGQLYHPCSNAVDQTGQTGRLISTIREESRLVHLLTF